MDNLFEQGYEDYFTGAGYKDSTNPSWLRGWTHAERMSRCGWYDKQGKPSDINKAVR